MKSTSQQGRFINRRYRLETLLGEGAAGEVYLVRDALHDNAARALKLLSHDSRDARTRMSLQNEFSTLSRLRHPGLVGVHDLGQDHETRRWFLTLEYVEGGSLTSWQPPDAEAVASLTEDLLSALDYIHGRGYVHADIKPDNILLAADGRTPRITDFGLAGVLGLPASRRGTLPYTAPEVLRGDSPAQAADFYSLGATLYQVLFGQPPFPGPSPDRIIEGHLRHEPEFPASAAIPIADGYLALLRRLLAKEPEARPRSGHEVRNALHDLTGMGSRSAAAAACTALRSHPAYAGRQAETRQLDEHLQRLVSRQQGGLITVHGPAGIGRSRFLEEAVIAGQLSGATVMRAALAGGAEDPLAPVLPVLAALCLHTPDPPPRALQPLLHAAFNQDKPEPDQAVDHNAVREAAARVLRQAAAAGPLLITWDDLHEAHSELLALLAHMVRGSDGYPVLHLLSYATTGKGSSPTPVADLTAERQAVGLELLPLDDEACHSLLRSLLGRRPVDDHILSTLTRGLAGNPFMLTQAVQAFRAAGVLDLGADGEWHLDAERVQDVALPASAEQAALRLGEQLPTAQRSLLTALSLSRTGMDAASLAELTGMNRQAAAHGLDSMVEQDLLLRQESGRGVNRFSFAHALLRQAVQGDAVRLHPQEVRRYRAARLKQLQRTAGATPAALAEQAAHARALEEKPQAADLHRRAAAAYRRRGSLAVAARQYESALELMVEKAPERAAILEELGDTQRAVAMHEAAASAYTQALDLHDEGERNPRARLLWKQASLATGIGRTADARRMLMDARRLARESGDQALLAQCFNAMGNSFAREGAHRRAERYFRRGLRLRRQLADLQAVAGSLANLGMVTAFQGRHEEGSQSLTESLEICRRIGDEAGVALAANNLGILASDRGALQQAGERFTEARDAYRSQGMQGREAECLMNRARVLMRCGLYHSAVTVAEEGLELRRRLGMISESGEALDLIGRSLAASGMQDAAQEAFERSLALARRHQEPVQEAFALLGKAGAHVSQGERLAAQSCLEAVQHEALDNPRIARRALLIRIDIAVSAGEADQARELLDAMRGRYASALSASEQVDLHILSARAAMTQARFDETLAALESLLEDDSLQHHPARTWVIHRLRASALSGLNRQADSRRARRQALDAFALIAGELPPDYRKALEATSEATHLRREGRHDEPARVAPARFLDTMYEVIEALTAVNDEEAMLDRVMGLALNLLGAERGLILLFPEDGGSPRVAIARNVEEETIADAITYSKQVVEQGRSGSSLVSPDARADPRLRDYASVSLFEIRSVICVPLQARNRILGTVYLDSRTRVIGFDEDDLRFLEAFAQHAATALDNAGMLRALQRENLTLRQQVMERYSFASIVGGSAAMREVFDTLRAVSESALPVLIRGESGTGKELVAKALHYNSLRKQEAFLSENCAAFPDALLESQLFGHIRGAFTGATSEQTGLFQEAHGGTLFLDEIGEMSAGLQARLTRVLESGELRPVGAAQPVQVDVRVIAATHRNLEEMAAQGSFRRDLLFRLNVIAIDLPALRQRREDIPLLVSHFLDELSRELGQPPPGIADGALELLASRDYPGNVRQLRNEVSRLLVFRRGDVITADEVRDLSASAVPVLDEYMEAGSASMPLKELEKQHILRALRETGGDRTQAARLLRVGRATIFRKIKEYDLDA